MTGRIVPAGRIRIGYLSKATQFRLRPGELSLPMISNRLGVAFFPIPKNAGTSVRHALYAIEHGKRFVLEEYPTAKQELATLESQGWVTADDFSTLFALYPPVLFERLDQRGLAGLLKFAIIRHPIDRVLSAYKNRVLFYRELERADFSEYGLPRWLPKQPDINTFIKYLDYYRKLPALKHHTRHQRVFLGPDLAFFDRIFTMQELPAVAAFLSERAGRPVILEKLRDDGPDLPVSSITRQSRRALAIYYDVDYALLGSYFQP